VLTQLLAKANVDAEAAVRRYERARQIVEAARPDLTEPFPKELRQIEDQFRAGQVDILRVFAARSSLIQDRRAALDALNELSQAAVGVSAATALPPATLLLPPVPQRPGGARGSEPAP
jgi:outer membrane protein TolC